MFLQNFLQDSRYGVPPPPILRTLGEKDFDAITGGMEKRKRDEALEAKVEARKVHRPLESEELSLKDQERHIVSEHKDALFVCNLCDSDSSGIPSAFLTYERARQHLISEHSVGKECVINELLTIPPVDRLKIYKCGLCTPARSKDFVGVSEQEVRSFHYEKVHHLSVAVQLRKPLINVICRICLKSCPSEAAFIGHFKETHSVLLPDDGLRIQPWPKKQSRTVLSKPTEGSEKDEVAMNAIDPESPPMARRKCAIESIASKYHATKKGKSMPSSYSSNTYCRSPSGSAIRSVSLSASSVKTARSDSRSSSLCSSFSSRRSREGKKLSKRKKPSPRKTFSQMSSPSISNSSELSRGNERIPIRYRNDERYRSKSNEKGGRMKRYARSPEEKLRFPKNYKKNRSKSRERAKKIIRCRSPKEWLTSHRNAERHRGIEKSTRMKGRSESPKDDRFNRHATPSTSREIVKGARSRSPDEISICFRGDKERTNQNYHSSRSPESSQADEQGVLWNPKDGESMFGKKIRPPDGFCSACNLSYTSRMARSHFLTKAHHFNASYKRQLCAYCSHYVEDLKPHLKASHRDSGFRCGVKNCQTEKLFIKGAIEHLITHHPKGYPTYRRPDEFLREGHIIGPFHIGLLICRICDSLFVSQSLSTVILHQILQHGVVVPQSTNILFCCRICHERKFNGAEQLNEHLKMHYDTLKLGRRANFSPISSPKFTHTLGCYFCKEEFNRGRCQERHLLEVHDDELFKCGKCPDFTTVEKRYLKLHLTRKHKLEVMDSDLEKFSLLPKDFRKILCDVCGEKWMAQALSLDKITDHGNKAHKLFKSQHFRLECRLCDISFKLNDSIKWYDHFAKCHLPAQKKRKVIVTESIKKGATGAAEAKSLKITDIAVIAKPEEALANTVLPPNNSPPKKEVRC